MSFSLGDQSQASALLTPCKSRGNSQIDYTECAGSGGLITIPITSYTDRDWIEQLIKYILWVASQQEEQKYLYIIATARIILYIGL